MTSFVQIFLEIEFVCVLQSRRKKSALSSGNNERSASLASFAERVCLGKLATFLATTWPKPTNINARIADFPNAKE